MHQTALLITFNIMKKSGLNIAFLHPDLGLGGAERLVVDAAVELVHAGHNVDMYTAYYDPGRCFEETRTGGFSVTVAGSWFPRHIGGKLLALCAYIRCILVALHIALTAKVSGLGLVTQIISSRLTCPADCKCRINTMSSLWTKCQSSSLC